jgi:hypothetical protein
MHLPRWFRKTTIPNTVITLLVVIIPLIVYGLLFTSRSSRLDYWGSVARFGFGPAILMAFVLLIACYLIPGWVGALVSYAAILVLFGLSLAGLWSQGYSSSMIVSGLLPWSDASNYYLDAQRLLAGGWFNQFSAWRPLSPGFLAFLLSLTGHSLQAAVAILVLITATSIYLLSREIQRQYGVLAGIVVAVLLFLYYRQRIGGTVLTENLGLALACLGFALLVRGANQENPGHARRNVLFGVFLVTLALNVRPGTFLILPALIIWVAIAFRKEKVLRQLPQHLPWMFLAAAAGVMLLAFAINSAAIRLVSNEPTLPFSNFSDTLYGVASGGKGFLQAGLDHPELNQLQGMDRHLRLFQITGQLILDHPMGLVRGALNQWSLFFFSGWYGLFSYVGGETRYVTDAARLALYLLVLAGVFCLARQKNSRIPSLLLLSALGVILSVPFVPPQDGHWLRLYAPSMPIVAILPALGLSYGLSFLQPIAARWVKIAPLQTGYSHPVLEKDITAVFSGALVLLILAGTAATSILAHRVSSPLEAPGGGCPAGQQGLYVRIDQGSLVNILDPRDAHLDWLPNFHPGQFKNRIHGMPTDVQMAEFLRLDAIQTLAHTIDLKTMQPVFLAVDTRHIPAYGVPLQACGNWSTTPEGKEYHFFYALALTRIVQNSQDFR